jgi:hypothetical protein
MRNATLAGVRPGGQWPELGRRCSYSGGPTRDH